jgi:hypothetical protein
MNRPILFGGAGAKMCQPPHLTTLAWKFQLGFHKYDAEDGISAAKSILL